MLFLIAIPFKTLCTEIICLDDGHRGGVNVGKNINYIYFISFLAANKNRPFFYLNLKLKIILILSLLIEEKNYRTSLGVPGKYLIYKIINKVNSKYLI